MLSLTYEITTALSHTDELISPPYDIAIVTISYGRVTKSPVWDTMMSKKNTGWPFYAAVVMNNYSHIKMWDTITQTCEYYYSPTFIGCGLDNRRLSRSTWISNYISDEMMHTDIYPCHNLNWAMLINGIRDIWRIKWNENQYTPFCHFCVDIYSRIISFNGKSSY